MISDKKMLSCHFTHKGRLCFLHLGLFKRVFISLSVLIAKHKNNWYQSSAGRREAVTAAQRKDVSATMRVLNQGGPFDHFLTQSQTHTEMCVTTGLCATKSFQTYFTVNFTDVHRPHSNPKLGQTLIPILTL